MRKVILFMVIAGLLIFYPKFCSSSFGDYHSLSGTPPRMGAGTQELGGSYSTQLSKILAYLKKVTGNEDLSLEDLVQLFNQGKVTFKDGKIVVKIDGNEYVFDKDGNIEEAIIAEATGEEARKAVFGESSDIKRGITVTVRKLHIKYDKFSRAVSYEGHVITAGYDNSGKKILAKEYDMERQINEFTASGDVASETVTQYNISGTPNLTVVTTTDYTRDEKGRIKTTNSVTTESGFRGDASESDNKNLNKTTERHEKVIECDEYGNPVVVEVEEIERTDEGETRKKYTEERTYKQGKVAKVHQEGTVTTTDGTEYNFTQDTKYTYNEIDQMMKVHTEYTSDKDGEQTKQVSTTVFGYDIYGRTAIQLSEYFIYKNGSLDQHFIVGSGPDPSGGSAFNLVGELEHKLEFQVNIGAGDSTHYFDQGDLEDIFNQFLAQDSGFENFQEYLSQLAGVDVLITSYYDL